MKIRHLLLAAFTLSALFGCDRPADFNYLRNHPQVISKSVPVKEIIATNEVDILWVIDNSGSMRDHQQNVINNMNTFITALTSSSKIKWKSGLLSTSEDNPPFGGFDPGTEWFSFDPDVADKMKTAIGQLGINGSSTEKTFTPILDKLKEYPYFMRPNAALAIIVITDAPDQSIMPDTWNTPITGDYFVDQLEKLKGNREAVYFYGFLNPRDWCNATDDSFLWSGSSFERVTKLLQGQVYKLCDPDFATKLKDLGTDLSTQVSKSRLYLKEIPRIKTLQVFYKDKILPPGEKSAGGFWRYRRDLNAIEFNDLTFAPGKSEFVRVYYHVDDGTDEPSGE